jgi:3'-phosphoadenosine 5'-phosphosulfate sulfotransferase (PAPS reductase)/FAD synthetase
MEAAMGDDVTDTIPTRYRAPDPYDPDVEVIASISGGKDSAAMGLWLIEQGIDFKAVFMDTGWESPRTYEWLRGPLTDALGREIVEIKNDKQMEDLILHKGVFPTRVRRYCTQELKVFVFRDWCAQNVDGELVNAVGIRRGESQARSQMGEWEFTDWLDGYVWRPLVKWTEQDVIDIHKRHNLRPNPLYLLGAERVGCWPCIYARKEEIALVAKHNPERIDQIRELEDEVTRLSDERTRAKGEEPIYHRHTFFYRRIDGERGPKPIDRVVEWSTTKYGGKEQLDEDEQQPEGCMRWGMCE